MFVVTSMKIEALHILLVRLMKWHCKADRGLAGLIVLLHILEILLPTTNKTKRILNSVQFTRSLELIENYLFIA